MYTMSIWYRIVVEIIDYLVEGEGADVRFLAQVTVAACFLCFSQVQYSTAHPSQLNGSDRAQQHFAAEIVKEQTYENSTAYAVSQSRSTQGVEMHFQTSQTYCSGFISVLSNVMTLELRIGPMTPGYYHQHWKLASRQWGSSR